MTPLFQSRKLAISESHLLLLETKSFVYFVGLFIHSKSLRDLEILPLAWLGVSSVGSIAFLFSEPPDQPLNLNQSGIEQLFQFWNIYSNAKDTKIVSTSRKNVKLSTFLRKAFWFLFIHTHIHASTIRFAGTGIDLPLLDWLNKYTFPTESKFDDESYAIPVYDSIVQKTLRFGTTTAAYYATVHRKTARLLADLAFNFGQRAFIGKVSMDRNSPNFYIRN